MLAGPVHAQTLHVDGGEIAAAVQSPEGVRAYKGIPYAAPPIGDLRWRDAQPLAPWKGVRAVDRFAPKCLQPKRYKDTDPFTPSMSEDCLYLNVWTAATPGESLPVFFWIHGGGYGAGSGSEPRHDGVALAKKGVVVVTINYRLGAFGFFAHPELSAQSPHHASGNQAFTDMIAALHWVQSNIAQFGGDPNRVTIAGESAGSDAVSRLMASPQAKDLFQRVIGESGSAFGTMHDMPLADAEKNGVAFAQAMSGDDLAHLRARSSAEILALESAPDTGWSFGPVIDGWFLPSPVPDIFAAGKQNDVPLIAGWNRDEGSLFQGILLALPVPQLLAQMFGPRADDAARFYPSATAEEEAASRAQLAGDMVIGFATWKWAVAQAKTGHAPVYLFQFSHKPPIPADWFGKALLGKDEGAFHSGEIAYVFGHPQIMPGWAVNKDDRALADMMSSYWSDFARNGDPNGNGRPAWPAYDPDAPQRMIFNDPSGVAAEDDAARMRFLAAGPITLTVKP